MIWLKLFFLIVGLGILIILPLTALLWITVALVPAIFRISRHRWLHLLPFWAMLALPVALGHPERATLYALRSLDSLLWVALMFAFWTQEDQRKILSVMPQTLRWVILLTLKHFVVFQGRLSRSTAALRLRWGRPPLRHYGSVFKGMVHLAERKAQRITFALKLREFE